MPRRPRKPAVAGVAFIALAAAPLSLAGAGAGGRTPLVIAHRGALRQAPENTLAAVDAAHRRGLLWVENDVRRTKDGRLVVMHDATLKRTTDAQKRFPGRAPWRVRDFTAAEIARLDAGSWFGRRFAGERVPTLADYLRRLDHNGQRLLLEIKSPKTAPGIERDIAGELRRQGWLDPEHLEHRLVIQSFSAGCVKAVHRLLPAVRTGFLGAPRPDRLAAYARFADEINPRLSAIGSRWLAAAHRLRGPHGRPLEVYGWDVGKNTGFGQALRLARARGIEGVIT